MKDVFSVNDSIRQVQIENIEKIKKIRDNAKVSTALVALKSAAQGDVNVMPSILEAVESYATLGEISDVLRSVFGEFHG